MCLNNSIKALRDWMQRRLSFCFGFIKVVCFTRLCYNNKLGSQRLGFKTTVCYIWWRACICSTNLSRYMYVKQTLLHLAHNMLTLLCTCNILVCIQPFSASVFHFYLHYYFGVSCVWLKCVRASWPLFCRTLNMSGKLTAVRELLKKNLAMKAAYCQLHCLRQYQYQCLLVE